MHASCLQFQARLLHIKFDPYPGISRKIETGQFTCLYDRNDLCQSSEAITNLSWKAIYLAIWLSHTASYLSAFLGFPLTTSILMFQAPSEAVLNKSMIEA